MPTSNFNITVPSNKVWNVIYIGVDTNFKVNGKSFETNNEHSSFSFWLTPGNSLSLDYYDWEDGHITHISILEYSISGSGTDQGMDYVEP